MAEAIGYLPSGGPLSHDLIGMLDRHLTALNYKFENLDKTIDSRLDKIDKTLGSIDVALRDSKVDSKVDIDAKGGDGGNSILNINNPNQEANRRDLTELLSQRLGKVGLGQHRDAHTRFQDIDERLFRVERHRCCCLVM